MTISVQPRENGTAVVTVAPTDENGTALTIDDLSNACWQLMDDDGEIVNDRSFDLCSLTSLEWALTGNDLAITETGVKRHIAFKAEYSSTIGGEVVDDLVVIDEEAFFIKDLKSMPMPAE